MKGDRERCLAAGSDEYISKPIQIRQFLDTLEKVLAPRRAAPESIPSVEPCVSALPQAMDAPVETRLPTEPAAPNGNRIASAMSPAEVARADDAAPVWNPVAALRAVGGDRGLLCELIDSFLEERPKLMANLQRAVDTSDPDRLQFAAHVLKGSMRCFHAPQAMQPAEEMEAMGREKRLTDWDRMYDQVVLAVERLAEALSAHLDQEVRVKPK
jgi:HPt (histidine-containing phosphotransfer) domain-containing protein